MRATRATKAVQRPLLFRLCYASCARIDYAQEVTGQDYLLNRFVWIVEIDVAMRLWVLIAANGTGKEVLAGFAFRCNNRLIGQRAALRMKRLTHQVCTNDRGTISARRAHRDFNLLHRLQNGAVIVSTNKCEPNVVTDRLV